MEDETHVQCDPQHCARIKANVYETLASVECRRIPSDNWRTIIRHVIHCSVVFLGISLISVKVLFEVGNNTSRHDKDRYLT